ncbi:hypothetical protein DSC45_00175 [Streptomyces sp. YIM 130001]|uniref:TIGR03086 family metal-binding protein n=1 Tax=Streptomyces sp. YIM 130001 TaxID=2259644 RepID=UPI000E65397A|nr:TIGR03086 family metal-binding protein [Streptomyces sp. YIM 130001]RII22128.1 hypothetical protein DSC45_00175 [Streptomyces sp. YIM 130001]
MTNNEPQPTSTSGPTSAPDPTAATHPAATAPVTTPPATPTEPISTLLETAAAHAVPVVSAIRDEQLTAPTPCAEYDVRQLLNHLMQVVSEFQKLAVKVNSDFTGDIPDRVAEPGWRDRFAEETAALAAAWAQPGAEDGNSGSMNLPARTVGVMGLVDVTVHAWDLARATGQDYDRNGPSPATTATLNAFFDDMAPMARQYGVLGEPFPAPQDATDFEALLAATGRDPHWKP